MAEESRPSLVIARTTIAKGAPTKEGTAGAHGEPLGKEELRRAKEAAGWPLAPEFHVPEEARAHFREIAEGKRAERRAWLRRFEDFRRECLDGAAVWDAHFGSAVPEDLEARLRVPSTSDPAATRSHSAATIGAAARAVPALVGGSADLEPSTMTRIEGGGDVAPEGLRPGAPVRFEGRVLHFGVREHAMGAIGNGIALHGSFIPYLGTFLIFSDYMRPSIRLAALMRIRVIYVFTHDSVFLGEDGPTHQPIEQLPSLRLIPGLHVWRPADALETAAAWTSAIRRVDGPSALVLTRQKLPPVSRGPGFDPDAPARGGYVLADPATGFPEVILVATGSEVPLVEEVRAILESSGIPARTVSMPCLEIFRRQPESYRDAVIPRGVRRVVVEAARVEPWCELLGHDALLIGMTDFGASAPSARLAEHFGFTPEAVARRVRRSLGRA